MQRTFGDRIWGEGFCDGNCDAAVYADPDHDIGVAYSSSVTPEQKSELESKEQDGVEKSAFVAEKSMDLVGSEKTKSVSLIIADPDSDMTPFVNLHTEKGVPITFPKKERRLFPQKWQMNLG